MVFDYNLYCATASQQNRDAIGNAAPRQDVIAGGYTKVNTVDNVISLYMDEQMRLRGEMRAHFLKTRSADGVGKSAQLFFDTKNLRITDPDSASNRGLFDLTKKENDYKIDAGRNLPEIDDLDINSETQYTDENNIINIETKRSNKANENNLRQSDLLNFMEELENE